MDALIYGITLPEYVEPADFEKFMPRIGATLAPMEIQVLGLG